MTSDLPHPFGWAYRIRTDQRTDIPIHFFYGRRGVMSLCGQVPFARCTPVRPDGKRPHCRLCANVLKSRSGASTLALWILHQGDALAG